MGDHKDKKHKFNKFEDINVNVAAVDQEATNTATAISGSITIGDHKGPLVAGKGDLTIFTGDATATATSTQTATVTQTAGDDGHDTWKKAKFEDVNVNVALVDQAATNTATATSGSI